MTRRRTTFALLAVLALLTAACDQQTTVVDTSTTVPAEIVTTTQPGSTPESSAGSPSTTAGESSTTTSSPTDDSTTTTTLPDTTTSTFPEEATTTTAPPNELVVMPYGTLGGVELGTDFETAAPMLEAVFGEAEADSGWVVGCPLDGEDENERILRWGALEAHFYLVDTGRLVAWTVNDDRGAIPGGAILRLPGGATMGDPMAAVATGTGVEVVLDGTFDAAIIAEDGYTLWGFPADVTAPLMVAGVPFVPACE